ncbi:MAG: hypothetical protein V7L14_18130 [Nostoc sp.]|uniref:hypothetical protein n=1 Tax=Nostoc sp. TaxID=1180 RepID=UPI002FF5EE4D
MLGILGANSIYACDRTKRRILKSVTRILRQADLINQSKQLVVKGIITLPSPSDFPQE